MVTTVAYTFSLMTVLICISTLYTTLFWLEKMMFQFWIFFISLALCIFAIGSKYTVSFFKIHSENLYALIREFGSFILLTLAFSCSYSFALDLLYTPLRRCSITFFLNYVYLCFCVKLMLKCHLCGWAGVDKYNFFLFWKVFISSLFVNEIFVEFRILVGIFFFF